MSFLRKQESRTICICFHINQTIVDFLLYIKYHFVYYKGYKRKTFSYFWIPASAGMTSIFLDCCYLLPAFAGTGFAGTGFAGTSSAGMTKRSGNVSLIICLLYYFANFWEMILFFLFEKTSMSPTDS